MPAPTPTPEPEPEPAPTIVTYTVSFNTQGGSSVSAVSVNAGETISTAASSTRDGYALLGWYTDEDLTQEFRFGSNGTVVRSNMTLYAKWVINDPDASAVEYAITQAAITYSAGDNQDYVTSNITLPDSVDISSASYVPLSWESSNSSAISTAGNVTRQTEDAEVTLTATATSGDKSASREFVLTLIKARAVASADAAASIVVNDVDWLQVMNASDDSFRVAYKEGSTQVTEIDGGYSSITINNADDAVDALQSIHTAMGISNPYNELVVGAVNTDEYGSEYSFAQTYEGVRVYGRTVMASANAEGEADFVSSNFLPTEILDAAKASGDLTASITQDAAETTAKTYFAGSFDIGAKETETVIYSLGDYEASPVVAYIVNVAGVEADNTAANYDIFVNGKTGEVIFYTVKEGALTFASVTIPGSGIGERDASQTLEFPVTLQVHLLGDSYLLYDSDLNIQMYTHNYAGDVLDGDILDWSKIAIESDSPDSWDDPQAVSVYAVMRDVMQWWKSEFLRNSLDAYGGKVSVIMHFVQLRAENWHISNTHDNAGWVSDREVIIVNDPEDWDYVAANDVFAHETAHAVFWYRNGGRIFDFPSTGITGTINEGYADIFGCLMDSQDWTIGEDLFSNDRYIRNIENPNLTNCPATLSDTYFYTGLNDNLSVKQKESTRVHTNSTIISHAAYLMHTKGMDYETLGKLWYKSMTMGYNAQSDFYSVRKCVLKAAKKLFFSDDQTAIIKEAFDEVEIFDKTTPLTFEVSEHGSGNTIDNVSISAAYAAEPDRAPITNNVTGDSALELPAGTFIITITKDGYVPLRMTHTIHEGLSETITINMVNDEGGTATINGTLTDSLNAQRISDATVILREGLNIHSGDAAYSVITSSDGTFSFEDVDEGYYSLEVSQNGYLTLYYDEIIVGSGDVLSVPLLFIQDDMNLDQYRVTLQWDENPRDLDSHLLGSLTDGSSFHVAYYSRDGYNADNELVANLDHDDVSGNGFETVTFEKDSGGKYEYFVHWYAGDGTWAGSNAVVTLYRGSTMLKRYIVPQVDQHGDDAGRYWRVFVLNADGTRTDIDALASAEPSFSRSTSITRSYSTMSTSNPYPAK